MSNELPPLPRNLWTCECASPPPQPLGAPADASSDVLAERERQKTIERWSPEHDDEHDTGELAAAALCYIAGQADKAWWPWSNEHWKPKDRRSNLVRAGALILAEIERLDRASSTKEQAP